MKTLLIFILFLPALAFAQPEIKNLPVTCVSAQEAEKVIDKTQDVVLLAGVSEIHSMPAAVFYHTQTGYYTIVLMPSKDKACFLDIGRGSSKAFGDAV